MTVPQSPCKMQQMSPQMSPSIPMQMQSIILPMQMQSVPMQSVPMQSVPIQSVPLLVNNSSIGSVGPISTTTCLDKALGFCNDSGIVLELQAANTKTRYFDVSWLSHFEHEQERLVTG
eukprot:108959_1